MSDSVTGESPALHFPRELEPFDYLMFRAESDPRVAHRGSDGVDARRRARYGRLRADSTRQPDRPADAPARRRARRATRRRNGSSTRTSTSLPRPAHPPAGARARSASCSTSPRSHRRAARHGPPAVGGAARRRDHRGRVARGADPQDAPRDLRRHRGLALFSQLYDFEREVDRGPLPPIPSPEDVTPSDLARNAVRRLPMTTVADARAARRRRPPRASVRRSSRRTR